MTEWMRLEVEALCNIEGNNYRQSHKTGNLAEVVPLDADRKIQRGPPDYTECSIYPPANWFTSDQSLRQDAITHMRPQETSVDDRLDMDNYAPNVRVMSLTYDQSVELRPLGSNNLRKGREPRIRDVNHHLRPNGGSCDVSPQGDTRPIAAALTQIPP